MTKELEAELRKSVEAAKENKAIVALLDELDRVRSSNKRMSNYLIEIGSELWSHGDHKHDDCWGCIIKDLAVEALKEQGDGGLDE